MAVPVENIFLVGPTSHDMTDVTFRCCVLSDPVHRAEAAAIKHVCASMDGFAILGLGLELDKSVTFSLVAVQWITRYVWRCLAGSLRCRSACLKHVVQHRGVLCESQSVALKFVGVALRTCSPEVISSTCDMR